MATLSAALLEAACSCAYQGSHQSSCRRVQPEAQDFRKACTVTGMGLLLVTIDWAASSTACEA